MEKRRRLGRTARLTAAGSLTAFLLGSVTAQDTHPFSVHDMLAMDRISDPQVSPDGSTLVFVLRKTDLEHNRGAMDLWTIGADGSDLRRLTSSPAADSSPRWDPSGNFIWFLSGRSGSSQVWRIDLRGGEAQQVTQLPLDVDNLVLSPDGSRLVVSMEVFPDCTSLECTAGRLETRSETRASGRTYEQLFVRHWDVWEDGRRSHLFSLSRDGESPHDLMAGMEADCPSKPFGGMEEVAVSPDGREVVFAAKDVGRSEAWSTNFDLFSVPIDGTAKPASLTAANQAWDTMPAFSPDGRWLIYLRLDESEVQNLPVTDYQVNGHSFKFIFIGRRLPFKLIRVI